VNDNPSATDGHATMNQSDEEDPKQRRTSTTMTTTVFHSAFILEEADESTTERQEARTDGRTDGRTDDGRTDGRTHGVWGGGGSRVTTTHSAEVEAWREGILERKNPNKTLFLSIFALFFLPLVGSLRNPNETDKDFLSFCLFLFFFSFLF
jgi:hypothetical protein